jgi:hypothetical protein
LDLLAGFVDLARVGYAQANNKSMTATSTQPDSFSPRYTGILAVFRCFDLPFFQKSTAKKQNFIEEVSKTTYHDTVTQPRMTRNTNSFDPPTDEPANRATNCGCTTSRVHQSSDLNSANNRTHGQLHPTTSPVIKRLNGLERVTMSTPRRVESIRSHADKAQFLGARSQ